LRDPYCLSLCLPAFSAVFSGRNAGSDRSLARHYYPLYLASKFPLPVRA
jgi:hypothetical protein